MTDQRLEAVLAETKKRQLLRALAECQPEPGAWVLAESVGRRIDGLHYNALSTGRKLSRLARTGECERRFNEQHACWEYRP